MRNKYFQLAALAVLLSGCNSNDYTADTQESLSTPSYPVNNKTNSKNDNFAIKLLDCKKSLEFSVVEKELIYIYINEIRKINVKSKIILN